MNLRRQLLLVSLLTLVLPWAGYQFVRETESALRTGQQRMLSISSQAIADSLSQFPDEFLAGGDGSFDDGQVYGHPLGSAPVIDGYFDDWPLTLASLRDLRGADGVIRFVFGISRQHVFLYAEVRDSNVVYAMANTQRSESDQVVLVSEDEHATVSRILFATGAPGTVQAERIIGDTTAIEQRISAHWQDTPTGYSLEARIPRNLLGAKLGIEVHNAGSGTPVVSRSFGHDGPGRFVTTSPLLQSVAAGYAQPGMRLTITNRTGWRLAQAGSLSAALGGKQFSAAPTGWQSIAYRALLEQGDAAVLAEADPSGREQQNYIARALSGEASTRWFRNSETGRAVVAVARPVWSGSVQTGALIVHQDTDAILSLTNESLMRLITLTIIATVGSAAALLGYASWLSLRIRRLSHAADHALDTTQTSIDLPSGDAADEVGDLSRSFSSVLRQLAGYNEYLRSLASKLSHELRTPLTIVTSSLENLEHEPLSEQSREYTERALTGAVRLRKILSAMSEANRVEQVMENADTERFDMQNVLVATTAAYRDAWPERRFTFHAEEAEYSVQGSPELIIQMLDKLVDNAVDFSEVNDEIVIELARSEKHVILTVANPGPPLPEKMRGRLFDSMVSVRAVAGSDNLGLGLNISKLIAEGHGGSIDAQDTADGVQFCIRLPVA